jgi:S1-C subfamily serine protease
MWNQDDEIPEPIPRRGFQRLSGGLRKTAPFAGGVLAAFLALWLYGILAPAPQPLTAEEVSRVVDEAMASATPAPAFSAQVYQVIQPSLVLIQSEREDHGKTENGLGSGVVISDQGQILTALHVVEDAVLIEVVFADGTHSGAQVIAAQPENDIAVLQTEQLPGVLVPAVLGNPGAMHVGDEAYAFGNPFGLYGSMSAGIISGFDRTFSGDREHRIEGLIQFDSAVNPGNSGGPLLNRSGQVIGVVVGILNPTEDDFFVGIGFAVPITVAGGAAGAPPY